MKAYQCSLSPVFAALILLALCAAAAPALAHGLHVFAWLENGQIMVEGSFGKDRPAINADVTVNDTTDNRQILTGKTNANGRFTFAMPGEVRLGHPLAITVNAGQGHQGQWQLNPQELYAAASLAAGFETADLAAGRPAAAPMVQTVQRQPAQTAGLPAMPAAASMEDFRSIVQQELENQLAPVRQELAAQAVRGPGLVEIIGGLGWIIGLVGIGLYFKSRKS